MTQAQRMQLKRNDDALKQDISAGLHALRASKGWTRKELAALLPDVTIGDLQSWENQSAVPKQLKLLRIARLLGLDLSSYPVDAVRMVGILRAQRLANAPAHVIDVATLVATARIQTGLSIKDFAVTWGVATQTLRNWESGHLPCGDHAARVAERLGLPPSAISSI